VDPESKKLLEETFVLTQENNSMLRSMKRSMRWARIMRIIYWVIIVGVSVGAYYFIQPYINQLLGVYSGAKSNFDNVGSVLKNLTNQ